MCHGRVLHFIEQVFILGKSLVGLCVGEGFSLAFGRGETLPQSWIFKNFSLMFISLNGSISTPGGSAHTRSGRPPGVWQTAHSSAYKC